MKSESRPALQKPLRRLFRVSLVVFAASGAALAGWRVGAQNAATTPALLRPQYKISAAIDYQLLTLKSTARVTIPASDAEPLSDAVFFLYANAGGVGGDDERRKNLVVDEVKLGQQKLPWKSDGAVLRVSLPEAQKSPFEVEISYHGVVPRAPAGSGGLGDMMGGLGADISGLLGIGGEQKVEKPKNIDYGLFTYGNGILSLGSFWYPALAVRENGKWADAQPEGLGDVAYAEKSDFEVKFSGLPAGVEVVAPGKDGKASNLREFPVLMSEDFVVKSKTVEIVGKPVKISSYALKKNAAKLDKTLDIASHALQIYSKRFGPYPYDTFQIVEAPMRAGAGGMEYSGVIGIASPLYGEMEKQLGGLMTTLNLPGADELLAGLEADANGPPAKNEKNEAKNGGKNDAGNPMSEMLGGILGQQKAMFDSMFEETIAHEVAHQWWAIGVGSDSVRHPFVDESLTNWSSMLYFDDRYGAETGQKMRDLHLKTTFSMGALLGGGDAPANLPTAAYKNNLQYGAVIYGKGALFFDELRGLVGDEAFFAALREYYARYNDKIAGPRSFLEIVAAKSPAKKAQVAALYKHWIEEAHGSEDISGGMGNISDLLGGVLGGNMGGLMDN